MGSRLKKSKDRQDDQPRRHNSRLGAGKASADPPQPRLNAARQRVQGSGDPSAHDARVPPPPPPPPPSSLLPVPPPCPPTPHTSDPSLGAVDMSPTPIPSALVDVVADYWYALGRIGSVFRLESTQFVLQDWDPKAEYLRVCVSASVVLIVVNHSC